MLRIVTKLEFIGPTDDEQVACLQLVLSAIQFAPAGRGFHEEEGDHVRGESRAFDVPIRISRELPEPVDLQAVATLVDERLFVMMRKPAHG